MPRYLSLILVFLGGGGGGYSLDVYPSRGVLFTTTRGEKIFAIFFLICVKGALVSGVDLISY